MTLPPAAPNAHRALVVRLKVLADRFTEIELVAPRSRAEGLIFNIDGLSAPSAVMNYAPRPEQLTTREEVINAAMHRPEGLNAAKTFAAVNAPFAPNAYRYENGQVMAGPDCKFAPGCQNIATQSLAIFCRRGEKGSDNAWRITNSVNLYRQQPLNPHYPP